ncbi:MAG: DUF3368 domain-containing protein [Acidobacteriota bacterium]
MPDPVGSLVVVVNATPIISLAVLDRLDLLRDLYGAVLVPSAVHQEILLGGAARAGVSQLDAAPWIEVVRLEDPRRADLLSDLDRGEAEVIALAQERDADLVVIDERLGRRHALRLGLSLTGTLGILLKAKQQKLLPNLRSELDALQDVGIHLGQELITRVLELADESG